jgi:predicted TIM-barrel enzyme
MLKSFSLADGWIIGSSVKFDSYWENPINPIALER